MPEDISIIVPVCQMKGCALRDSLDSLCRQTLSGMEILLINSDASRELWSDCEEYAWFDQRVKTVNQMGLTSSAAKNIGISLASGRYLLFLDTDDRLADGALGSLVSAAKKEKPDVLIFQSCQVTDASSPDQLSADFVRVLGSVDARTLRLMTLRDEKSPYADLTSVSNKLISKKMFLDSSFRFQEDKTKKDADLLFNLTLYENAKRIALCGCQGVRHAHTKREGAFPPRLDIIRELKDTMYACADYVNWFHAGDTDYKEALCVRLYDQLRIAERDYLFHPDVKLTCDKVIQELSSYLAVGGLLKISSLCATGDFSTKLGKKRYFLLASNMYKTYYYMMRSVWKKYYARNGKRRS